MMEIPDGEFMMGYSVKAATDAFSIDLYETTNAEFAGQFPNHSYPAGAEAHPVTGITRKEAALYCDKNRRTPAHGAGMEKPRAEQMAECIPGATRHPGRIRIPSIPDSSSVGSDSTKTMSPLMAFMIWRDRCGSGLPTRTATRR